MTIDSVVLRHGKKGVLGGNGQVAADQTAGRDFAGSEMDMKVPLAEEGLAQMKKVGSEAIAKPYDLIVVVTSDFRRTKETAACMLNGAGIDASYENDSVVSKDGRVYVLRAKENIGLSGMNWESQLVPDFKKLPLDDYIKQLQENLYFQKTDPLNQTDRQVPATSAIGYRGLVTLDDALEYAAGTIGSGQKALVLMATHAPVVDCMANPMIEGNIAVDVEKRLAVLNKFPGSFQMGSYFTGEFQKSDDGLVGSLRIPSSIPSHNGRTYSLWTPETVSRVTETLLNHSLL